jgi:hypothetical protein
MVAPSAVEITAVSRLPADATKGLRRDGYWVVPQISDDDLEPMLAELGPLLPQYDGKLAYEVTYQPGFESFRYSKSNNGIGPHTEVPVYSTPPKYLALYCRRQATCGGGYTCLADSRIFIDQLTPAMHAVARTQLIDFAATPNPRDQEEQLSGRFPLISPAGDGATIFRFSHNYFYFGDANARADQHPALRPSESDTFNNIVENCVAFFDNHKIAIRLEENDLLIWNNHRMLHARDHYADKRRHLTRYWVGA